MHKNLNQEILTKNLATFREKEIEYYGGSLKNPIFRRGGFTKNHYIGGNCLTEGVGFGQFADLRGGGGL